jgi:hypothetical protein
VTITQWSGKLLVRAALAIGCTDAGQSIGGGVALRFCLGFVYYRA